MDFEAFDQKTIAAYAERAKAEWGGTQEYREYAEKAKGRTVSAEQDIAAGLMQIFATFGAQRGEAPGSAGVRALVEQLQGYISEHYYHCSDEMLCNLAQMYTGDASFRQNIDRAGGEGTAAFVRQAIEAYVKA